MNTRTHTIKSLDQSKFVAVPAPDLMALIENNCPGKDGLSLLYSLTGSMEMRIASLAGMLMNSMASALQKGNDNHEGIDKFGEALNALDEIDNRLWAFDQAGIEQHDMMQDLKDLIGFHKTVHDRLVTVSGKLRPTSWAECIERAATPQAVDEWKLELSYTEYLEACHGKPEMTEDEFRKLETINLSGTKKNYADHISKVMDVIEAADTKDMDFHDVNVPLQKRLLETISSPEKEAKFRTSALKVARSPADLDTRRRFISSFCSAARLALTHSRYREATNTESDSTSAADRSDKRVRATLKQQALENAAT